jgi:hypothetical protein
VVVRITPTAGKSELQMLGLNRNLRTGSSNGVVVHGTAPVRSPHPTAVETGSNLGKHLESDRSVSI